MTERQYQRRQPFGCRCHGEHGEGDPAGGLQQPEPGEDSRLTSSFPLTATGAVPGMRARPRPALWRQISLRTLGRVVGGERCLHRTQLQSARDCSLPGIWPVACEQAHHQPWR